MMVLAEARSTILGKPALHLSSDRIRDAPDPTTPPAVSSLAALVDLHRRRECRRGGAQVGTKSRHGEHGAMPDIRSPHGQEHQLLMKPAEGSQPLGTADDFLPFRNHPVKASYPGWSHRARQIVDAAWPHLHRKDENPPSPAAGNAADYAAKSRGISPPDTGLDPVHASAATNTRMHPQKEQGGPPPPPASDQVPPFVFSPDSLRGVGE